MIKEEIEKTPWHYYAHFVAVFIGIMIYGKYKCTRISFKDPLKTQIIKGFDLWAISHFTFYMYIGYMYPDKFYLSSSIGILWELIEFINGKYFIKYLEKYGNCNKKEIWWYGKYSDIVINVIGFLIGQRIAKRKDKE